MQGYFNIEKHGRYLPYIYKHKIAIKPSLFNATASTAAVFGEVYLTATFCVVLCPSGSVTRTI